ncbi:hypothetical protein GCM10027160_34610 [Streptomyces calidiresistens]
MTHEALGQQEVPSGRSIHSCAEPVSELVIPHPDTVLGRNTGDGARYPLRAYSIPQSAAAGQVQRTDDDRRYRHCVNSPTLTLYSQDHLSLVEYRDVFTPDLGRFMCAKPTEGPQ